MSRRCRRPRQCQATVYSEACSYNSCPGHSHKDSIQRSTRNTVIKTASREAPGTQSQRPRPEKHPEQSHKDRVQRSIRNTLAKTVSREASAENNSPARRSVQPRESSLPLHTAFLISATRHSPTPIPHPGSHCLRMSSCYWCSSGTHSLLETFFPPECLSTVE